MLTDSRISTNSALKGYFKQWLIIFILSYICFLYWYKKKKTKSHEYTLNLQILQEVRIKY